jgi:hypothetical protein
MPLAHRRLYGWDEENEEWVKILVDEDGKLTRRRSWRCYGSEGI